MLQRHDRVAIGVRMILLMQPSTLLRSSLNASRKAFTGASVYKKVLITACFRPYVCTVVLGYNFVLCK